MSFNQTRDLLDFAQQFHRRLTLFYEELLSRAADDQTRALIGTLIEHEQVLEKRMDEYEEEVSANIADTFFKYIVEKHEECFSNYPIPETVTAEQVITATRYFDDMLGAFYQEMAKKAMSEHVREALLSLMQMELREQMGLSRRTLELVASY